MSPEPSREPADLPVERCLNCGAEVLGEHCYACGLMQVESNWFFFTTLAGFADDPQLAARAMRLLPQVVFFLVPIFALLLQPVYWRGGRLYVEHLIFALHFHGLCL